MKFLTLGEKMNPAILALNGTLCSGEGFVSAVAAEAFIRVKPSRPKRFCKRALV